MFTSDFALLPAKSWINMENSNLSITWISGWQVAFGPPLGRHWPGVATISPAMARCWMFIWVNPLITFYAEDLLCKAEFYTPAKVAIRKHRRATASTVLYDFSAVLSSRATNGVMNRASNCVTAAQIKGSITPVVFKPNRERRRFLHDHIIIMTLATRRNARSNIAIQYVTKRNVTNAASNNVVTVPMTMIPPISAGKKSPPITSSDTSMEIHWLVEDSLGWFWRLTTRCWFNWLRCLGRFSPSRCLACVRFLECKIQIQSLLEEKWKLVC